MRSEEEYDYCEDEEIEERPEEPPDAQLIREDIAGINESLRRERGTW